MARPSNVVLKVERSEIHLKALETAVREFRFAPEKSHKITHHEDAENLVVRVESLDDETPLRIGLIAGDFIGNLRSSLDHLICVLVGRAKRKVTHEHGFPVFCEDSLDTQLKIVRATFGIGDDAISIVKSFQPYQSGDASKSTHLWKLHKLWNMDKHRNIAFHSTISGDMLTVPSAAGPFIQSKTLDNGAEMRIPLRFKDEVKFNPWIGINIRFGNNDEGITLYVNDLRDIYEFVSKKVIPSFDRFFA